MQPLSWTKYPVPVQDHKRFDSVTSPSLPCESFHMGAPIGHNRNISRHYMRSNHHPVFLLLRIKSVDIQNIFHPWQNEPIIFPPLPGSLPAPKLTKGCSITMITLRRSLQFLSFFPATSPDSGQKINQNFPFSLGPQLCSLVSIEKCQNPNTKYLSQS